MDIKFITFESEDFSEVKRIRTEVFTNEQGAQAENEFDSFDSDKGTVFALLCSDKKAVATARLVKTEKGFKIGRIAVSKEKRGLGLGDVIVRAVVDKAFENGASSVYVDAQNYAVGFYEKIGFKVIGSQLIDRGLPHMPMCLDKNKYTNNYR